MTRPAPKPVVFLPGLLCDGALWAHQTGHLTDVADCWVADLTGDDSIAAMAETVLEEAPFETFSLAALSMGGYVACEIMRRAPQRVRRLALMDTSYLSERREHTERRRSLMAMSEMGQFRGVTPRLLPVLIHEARLEDEAITSTIMDMAERIGPEAFRRQQQAIIGRLDSSEVLRQVTCPALVLCGREDRLTPLAQHEEMAAMIPGSKLVIVEESGHLPPLEQPEAVTAVLRYWLQV